MTEPLRVLAEVAVEPAVEGTAHRALVAAAVEALRGPGLQVRPGGMSTIVAGDLDEVLHAVQRAHASATAGAERVVTTVRLESRRDGDDLDERRREVAGGEPA